MVHSERSQSQTGREHFSFAIHRRSGHQSCPWRHGRWTNLYTIWLNTTPDLLLNCTQERETGGAQNWPRPFAPWPSLHATCVAFLRAIWTQVRCSFQSTRAGNCVCSFGCEPHCRSFRRNRRPTRLVRPDFRHRRSSRCISHCSLEAGRH